MQIDDILAALVAIVQETLDVPVVAGEVKRPLQRACAKIDILPCSLSAGCEGQRDISLDIDIWYYAEQQTMQHMRSVASKLSDALWEGFPCGGIWLIPDDTISSEVSKDVLVVQCILSYSEHAEETGEMMENLIYNKEGNTNAN